LLKLSLMLKVSSLQMIKAIRKIDQILLQQMMVIIVVAVK